MWKVDVLNAAASFLKSLVRSKRASTGSECPSSTGSEIATSPVSTPTLPSPSSSDSGNSSLIFGLSPAECCCYAHSELIRLVSFSVFKNKIHFANNFFCFQQSSSQPFDCSKKSIKRWILSGEETRILQTLGISKIE